MSKRLGSSKKWDSDHLKVKNAHLPHAYVRSQQTNVKPELIVKSNIL